MSIPSIWIFIVLTSQKSQQRPIYYIRFSISLRMEGSGLFQLRIHYLSKGCPKYSQEHVVLIRYYGDWKSKMYLDMAKK
jgi:hypothetical protein